MSNNKPYQSIPFDPIADPAAVVIHDTVRFTVLTSRLIRLEYSPSGRFEDRPSQAFWFRRLPVPDFSVTRDDSRLIIETAHLRLDYQPNTAGFTSQSLTMSLLPDGPTWHYGDHDSGNLLGTTRTLDKVSGSTKLDPGLLSRDGWVVVDDSAALVFNESAWLEPRGAAAGTLDLYFFGYGRAYRDCLRDFGHLAGHPSLLPRWVLGNWWSRYWAYSDQELRNLMADFRAHAVPLSVCIIDMDWHLVDVGEGINGWTGYTWNSELFPDPAATIDWLHGQGLRTALNLHPALGVRPHEAMYAGMATRLGLDPASRQTIPFNIADSEFAVAYFELLHHPKEKDGIDFWWMDWQQGTQTGLAGLDPLWWLNHLHYYDLGRNEKRPFVFSRWGGLGNHRYPIGFSGDTVVSWESLAFQPYFTATAANVGYGWWSHDIGGHMEGVEDPELYTRWVQYGVFSPIFRLHSTKNPYHERRPWGYDAEVLRLTRDAMQLRHALIPYLYTMSRLDEHQNQAPVRPMYHNYPDRPEAYVCPQQYTFGTEIIAAPYTAPADPDTRLARQSFWLPPGDWYHFFSGEHYAGDAWHARYGAAADIPVFARAGAIVPLGPRVGWGGLENPDQLELHIFAGADGRFTLYEDDGLTKAYRLGAFALTTISQKWLTDQLKVSIGPVSGDVSVLPQPRSYQIVIYGVRPPRQIVGRIDGLLHEIEYTYDAAREILVFDQFSLDPAAAIQLTMSFDPDDHPRHPDRRLNRLHEMVAAFRMNSLAKMWLAQRLPGLLDDPGVLADFGAELTPSQMQALLEISQGVGVHYSHDAGVPHLVVVWNNSEAAAFRRHFVETNRHKWYARDRYESRFGLVPKFESYTPTGDHWHLSLDYFGLVSRRIEPGHGR